MREKHEPQHPESFSPMTFWEHLEVLRHTLIRIGLVIILFSILAFCCKDEVFSIILAPKNDNFLIYDVFDKVAEHAQMSMASYEDALKIFAPAHHGISRGNLRGKNTEMHDEPAHISNENGLSLLSGKGYGALVTRKFFENVNQETVEFAQTILPSLSKKNNILVCLAIISMSDISFGEMKEKLNFEENTLREALDELIAVNVVIEKKSKHKSLGFTYEINEMYHTCLCILFATLEMQRYSLKGISCCMGYGDYPIQF